MPQFERTNIVYKKNISPSGKMCNTGTLLIQ